MVRKKLAAAVAAIGALQADLVFALGMGELSLQSALNQPLEAEIKLLDTRDLDEAQIKINLADTEQFKRAGVSRDYFLTNLKFKIELDNRGGGVIRVTSRDPVIEPYLNFLVEARWPSGRLLREYTALLDLPVFGESAAATVAAPRVTESAPAPVQAASSVPAMTSSRSDRQTLSQGSLQAGEKYRVKQDDTLWEIAAKGRPNRSVSVQQTMVSIQRLNPNAFIQGNINRLKAGYVLRLPTEAEIADVSGREAIQQVAIQNRSWKSGETSEANTGGAQLDATSTASDSEEGYAEDARLSIATAGDSQSGVGGEGSGAGSAALRGELDASLENLDKTKRENAELQGRLDDMESKIATLQRLLELKDDQLAALQGEAAQQQDLAAMDSAADAVDGGEAMAEAVVDTEQAMPGSTDTAEASEAAAATEVVEQPEQVEAAAPEPKPAPKPAPAPEPELLDEILSNPLYTGGAGLIVLAIAALIIMRKRKAAAEEGEEEALELFEEPSEELADVSLDDELDLGGLEDSDDNADLLAAELEQEIAADNEAEAAMAEEEPSSVVKSETGDAIAEADIYIAYGRFQQAVELLSTAIAQEPQRSDLQVKLLEVYVETRDKPGFQQQYVALLGLGDDAAVGQVKEMLSSVDGVEDWLDNLPGDTDLSNVDMDAELIDGGTDDLALDLDDDLEIDLDIDSMGATQETEAISIDEELDLDGELDLDEELDLDLDLAESGEQADQDVTMMFDAVAAEESEPEPEVTGELSDDVLGDLSLDEELELDIGGDTVDLGDLSEGLDLDDEASSSAETVAVELDDLDLGELEAEPAADLTSGSAESATEEGFELDLEGDGDLDLDLGDLGETDLSDLEAEFGDAGDTAKPATADLEVNLDAAEDLADVDLGDLDLSETDTVTLDTGSTELELDTALDATAEDEVDLGDLESLSEELTLEGGDSEPELDVSLEEPAAPATDESFDASVSAPAASDDDFDFLADTDEVATKLDLARAYIDMGDTEGAKDILDEVIQEGNDDQKQEANDLMERV